MYLRHHLDKEFSVLLDVFVSGFLFLFLLSFHGDVDVHSELFAATKTELNVNKNKLFFNHRNQKPSHISLLLLISQEKLDDRVRFKIYFVHISVLILHYLKSRQFARS